jgi:hypothetical protein
MVFRAPSAAGLRGRAGQLVLLGSCAVLSACGPSFEVLAEGDLRFVHCDRLDLDPKIAPSHRLHCWREWRRTYTYGQTRDRVEYAQRRIAEVVSGDTESPFQLPSEQSAGARHRSSSPGLKPAAAAAPPGASLVAPAGEGSLAGGVAAGSVAAGGAAAASPEEVACRARCEAAQAACSPGCETRPTGCQRCERPLEACLGDCKSDAP